MTWRSLPLNHPPTWLCRRSLGTRDRRHLPNVAGRCIVEVRILVRGGDEVLTGRRHTCRWETMTALAAVVIVASGVAV